MTAVDDYLRRLGVAAAPPSVDALFALHRAQVERVPYETTWIQMGDPFDVSGTAALERVATNGRGGYCFLLNGAFATLLTALGYSVTRHIGCVHPRDALDEGSIANHLVLTVDGLPADDNPDGVWYVDAGLGDAMYEPLPLVAGTYTQPPLTFVLEEVRDGWGDWRFTHDPNGTFEQMTFATAPASEPDFAAQHAHLSTSPDSGFVKWVTIQRRDARGCDVIRGLTLFRIEGRTRTSRVIDDRDAWFAALADVFGLTLLDATAAAKDQLWARAVAAHEAWLELQAAERAG
jgi:N-hydroxyarylamine O-acetyltransferase